MEPITTSIAVATSAFNLISKGVAAGRDLNSLFGNIGKYMGAINDIDYKAHKKPKMFQKIFTGSSIEQEAMEAFAAKKKAEHMTQELKTWINLAYGPKAWDEILQLQGQIRKQRRELIYKKKEQEEELIAIALTLVGVFMVGGISLFVLRGLGII
jgi:hypothetical protein